MFPPFPVALCLCSAVFFHFFSLAASSAHVLQAHPLPALMQSSMHLCPPAALLLASLAARHSFCISGEYLALRCLHASHCCMADAQQTDSGCPHPQLSAALLLCSALPLQLNYQHVTPPKQEGGEDFHELLIDLGEVFPTFGGFPEI